MQHMQRKTRDGGSSLSPENGGAPAQLGSIPPEIPVENGWKIVQMTMIHTSHAVS